METKTPINSKNKWISLFPYACSQASLWIHMHIHKHPCESIPKFTNMQSLSSTLQVCISNLHAQCKPKPQLTHKNKQTSLFAYMYIRKHHCESKPKLTNMQSLSIILQACIQIKKNQVEFIYSLKYINKHGKSLASIWNIEVALPRTSINTL